MFLKLIIYLVNITANITVAYKLNVLMTTNEDFEDVTWVNVSLDWNIWRQNNFVNAFKNVFYII